MNHTYKHNMKYSIILFLLMVFSACETEFDNPNAPTDEQTFATKEGIFAASVGVQQMYTTTGLRNIIEATALTTREAAATSTFANVTELESGGSTLPNDNVNIEGFWAKMLQIIRVTTEIENSVDNVELDPGTKSGLLAFAKMFKAMSIGLMSQNFEQVIIETTNDVDASFVPRDQGFAEALSLLAEAKSLITANPPSNEFLSSVIASNSIDLNNSIEAYIARFSLFSGDYEGAITAANNVDLNSSSSFLYDEQSQNPIWLRVIDASPPRFMPRDNFGLPNEFTFNANDGRKSFYLEPSSELSLNNLPIENIKGFFTEATMAIPVYIPDEMNLIIAEANIRKNSPDLGAATTALNKVLTDNNDPFGVNANTSAYSGPATADALLKEIYKNRRAELFLSGLSLEDSRRFNRPQPSGNSDVLSEERNRNFYPYPDSERSNNPNTPADPNI